MQAAPDHIKRPFQLSDIGKAKSFSRTAFSPDGSCIVTCITESDLDANAHRGSIVLLRHDTMETLVEGANPIWCPDGSALAYEHEAGIWIYHLVRKEKKFLTPVYSSEHFLGHLTEKNFEWSPDGKYIAFLSTDQPADMANSTDVIETTRLMYKTKGGRGRKLFSDHRRTHIWLAPLDGTAPFPLTSGNFDHHSICWSPNSRQIAFISNQTADPDTNNHNDLFSIDIDTREIKRWTNTPGTRYFPSWSPGGDHIAYTGSDSRLSSKDSPADDTHIYIVSYGNKPVCLTRAFDRRVSQAKWDPAGSSILFLAGNQGRTNLYRVSLSGVITAIKEGDFFIDHYSGKDGQIVCARSAIDAPAELFLLNNSEKQISHIHTTFKNECHFQNAGMFWFKSFDHTDIQGWLMRPVAPEAGKKYPLLLVIHGGPHNMFGYEFEERMQVLAGAGYGVVYMNPRGSHGYGQQFSNGCVGNWGGGDYKDLMSGIDYLLHEHHWIDANRLGVTGQSYGGFMTNWIITQTNRFKAAVADGSISNLISFAGTSLYHDLMEAEFRGLPSDNFSLLWRWSPLQHVRNVQTPTLFLHGELDNEVPVGQAEEMYTALKKMGVETKLVRYAGEGHGWRPDLKPLNKVDLLRRMLQWFDHYLK